MVTEMKKAVTVFGVVFSAEIVFQLLISLVFHFFLCTLYEHIEEFTVIVSEYLPRFVKASLCITLVVIPIESIVMKIYARRYKQLGIEEKTLIEQQEKKVDRIVGTLGIIAVVIWFAHGLVNLIVVEGQLGLRHGSDEYMILTRPGAILCALPTIAAVISRIILFGAQKETPWHKLRI